jgi:SAM-dependent methyltransferase
MSQRHMPLDAPCPACSAAHASPAFDLGSMHVSRCGECGLYTLVGEARAQAPTALDRERFADAFRAIRLRNYDRILDDLESRYGLRGKRVLDVGSSNGWFLGAAAKRGCRGYGIEPDAFFCERARASLPLDVEVVQGYFPGDLPAGWGPFDVITFHDVFEHLEAPLEILQACRERLAAGGVAVVSLPSADGFVYRLGGLLYRLGWQVPLERMFQVNYPFPHLFYFTPRSLLSLARRAGFDVVRVGRVDGFAVCGSLSRAQMDEAGGAWQKATRYATAGALVSFALLQRLMPADNIYVILRPRGV